MNGLTIILALVTILAVIGTLSSFKGKNIMGIAFGLATLGVFGWFTIMTIVYDGYPV
ncbi:MULTISPECIES: DUF2759 domain-containing protein [Jeotgalibacillus]|uniref:Membrane protein n=1 Tax=Jeotgalibacillus campisalis TaxID=220754 RepID=A0A0C2R6W1_9BACL|nr:MULTISPECIES: DUF2759 domain-containing protein [Jeotgalibacillus]KIL45985.1 membrane protein [Jeotgalibacillus campisalis]MDG5470799.1 DUF2759 domain-containing protein [Jeotgalibacillus sp. ET6]